MPQFSVSLNQASDFKENRIHTGWLDNRIAMRVQAERPPWYISVVGGALYVRNYAPLTAAFVKPIAKNTISCLMQITVLCCRKQ